MAHFNDIPSEAVLYSTVGLGNGNPVEGDTANVVTTGDRYRFTQGAWVKTSSGGFSFSSASGKIQELGKDLPIVIFRDWIDPLTFDMSGVNDESATVTALLNQFKTAYGACEVRFPNTPENGGIFAQNLPIWSGLRLRGSLFYNRNNVNCPDLDSPLIGGTIFKGDGSAPLFVANKIAGGNVTLNATANTITLPNALPNGTPVFFPGSAVTTLPSEILADRTYYIVNASGATAQVSLTLGGAPVDFSTAGTNVRIAVNNVIAGLDIGEFGCIGHKHVLDIGAENSLGLLYGRIHDIFCEATTDWITNIGNSQHNWVERVMGRLVERGHRTFTRGNGCPGSGIMTYRDCDVVMLTHAGGAADPHKPRRYGYFADVDTAWPTITLDMIVRENSYARYYGASQQVLSNVTDFTVSGATWTKTGHTYQDLEPMWAFGSDSVGTGLPGGVEHDAPCYVKRINANTFQLYQRLNSDGTDVETASLITTTSAGTTAGKFQYGGDIVGNVTEAPPGQRITYTAGAQAFVKGERITGPSGTGVVREVLSGGVLLYTLYTGSFATGQAITGSLGASGTTTTNATASGNVCSWHKQDRVQTDGARFSQTSRFWNCLSTEIDTHWELADPQALTTYSHIRLKGGSSRTRIKTLQRNIKVFADGTSRPYSYDGPVTTLPLSNTFLTSLPSAGAGYDDFGSQFLYCRTLGAFGIEDRQLAIRPSGTNEWPCGSLTPGGNALSSSVASYTGGLTLSVGRWYGFMRWTIAAPATATLPDPATMPPGVSGWIVNDPASTANITVARHNVAATISLNGPVAVAADVTVGPGQAMYITADNLNTNSTEGGARTKNSWNAFRLNLA